MKSNCKCCCCPLHASAPDLLAALEMLVDAVENGYGRDAEDAYRRGDLSKDERDAFRKARAVIRKAKS